jgi:hypothetical protein
VYLPDRSPLSASGFSGIKQNDVAELIYVMEFSQWTGSQDYSLEAYVNRDLPEVTMRVRSCNHTLACSACFSRRLTVAA